MERPIITINYCIEWGYLEEAARAAVEILEEHLDAIGEVRLAPGHGGIFKIWLGRPDRDGSALVYDKKETGHFPQPGEALRALDPLM